MLVYVFILIPNFAMWPLKYVLTCEYIQFFEQKILRKLLCGFDAWWCSIAMVLQNHSQFIPNVVLFIYHEYLSEQMCDAGKVITHLVRSILQWYITVVSRCNERLLQRSTWCFVSIQGHQILVMRMKTCKILPIWFSLIFNHNHQHTSLILPCIICWDLKSAEENVQSIREMFD